MSKQFVQEGSTVYIGGYEFIATNVRVHRLEGTLPVLRFEGVCTDSPRNDDIRNTGYNGGTYGGNRRAYSFEGCECEYCGGTGKVEMEAYEGLATCPVCQGF